MSCKSCCAVFSAFLIVGILVAGYFLKDQLIEKFDELSKFKVYKKKND